MNIRTTCAALVAAAFIAGCGAAPLLAGDPVEERASRAEPVLVPTADERRRRYQVMTREPICPDGVVGLVLLGGIDAGVNGGL